MENNNRPSVIIGVPSHHGETPEATQRSLDAMIQYSGQNGLRMGLARSYGSVLPRNRNECVDIALRQEVDALLFVDADMVFEKDSLLRLLKLDRDIVSGLCVNRHPPFSPSVKIRNDKGLYGTSPHTTEGRFLSGLAGVGMAFTLIKMEVFRKVKQPWFAMPPLGVDVQGEDLYFCEKAIEAGFDICCDTSLIIGHLGQHIYTITDYVNYKEERESREKENKGSGSLEDSDNDEK